MGNVSGLFFFANLTLSESISFEIFPEMVSAFAAV